MDDNKELWSKILGEVELNVSRANFLTLFKRTVLLSLEGNVVTIAAPSAMIVDLLQRRFYEIIKIAIDKHTQLDAKIIFVPKTIVENIEKAKEAEMPLFEEEKTKVVGHLPRVRPDYTFENMAVSSSNQLAFVSATTVAKKLGQIYNPLFIYGPVGCGKTHLMQAIANDVFAKNPAKKILYITSEEFTNEVVESIRENNTGLMKRRFRNLDLLIIDDIQFIAGKEKIQEELFHTFNILVDNSSQIVLSSDRPPVEIKKVEKRLLSRFAGGLTVDIEQPDFELRTAILLIKARKYDINLSIGSAKIIAEKAQDARSLEGLLLRIITQAQSNGEEINEDFISRVMGEDKKEDHSYFHPDEIINNICSFYKIKPTQLKSQKRDSFLVKPRQVAMYVLKKELGLTYVEIGNILGGRDHTTIMYGVEKVENLISDSKFSEDILNISKLVVEKQTDY
jgi:chromosomal replication initiator protein